MEVKKGEISGPEDQLVTVIHRFNKPDYLGVHGFIIWHLRDRLELFEMREDGQEASRDPVKIPMEHFDEFIFALRLATAGELGREAMMAERLRQSQKEE